MISCWYFFIYWINLQEAGRQGILGNVDCTSQPARPTALQSRLEKERRVDLRAEPNGKHHRGYFRCEPVTSAYPRGDILTLWSTTGMSSLVTSRHGHWVFGCPSDHRSGMPEMGFQSGYESGQENKAAATANPLSSGSKH